MNKFQFLTKLAELYKLGDRSDRKREDKPAEEAWTRPIMVSAALIDPIQSIMTTMLHEGIITDEDFTQFFEVMAR